MSYENTCDVICVHEDKVNNDMTAFHTVLLGENKI